MPLANPYVPVENVPSCEPVHAPVGGVVGLREYLHIALSSSFDGRNQSVNPPPAYASAENAAPEVQGKASIAVVFALPVPTARATAPAMLVDVSLHHAKLGVSSLEEPLHVFGAIS